MNEREKSVSFAIQSSKLIFFDVYITSVSRLKISAKKIRKLPADRMREAEVKLRFEFRNNKGMYEKDPAMVKLSCCEKELNADQMFIFKGA